MCLKQEPAFYRQTQLQSLRKNILYKLFDVDQLVAIIEYVTLYKKSITVYQLVGSSIVFTANRSDVRLRHASSSNYVWTVNAFENNFTYQWRKEVISSTEKSPAIFRSFYKHLRSSTLTKKHDGVRLTYTVLLTNSVSFHSEMATLRIGGKIK